MRCDASCIYSLLSEKSKDKYRVSQTASRWMRSVAAYPSPYALSFASLCFIGLAGGGLAGARWHGVFRWVVTRG